MVVDGVPFRARVEDEGVESREKLGGVVEEVVPVVISTGNEAKKNEGPQRWCFRGGEHGRRQIYSVARNGIAKGEGADGERAWRYAVPICCRCSDALNAAEDKKLGDIYSDRV